MFRKTWIKLKRGLLEPKHREKIGPAFWLYVYILDRADWEQGAVLEWKDPAVADELQMELTTVREHRRRLEAEGYIRVEQKQYGLKITINNWTNPREYSGKLYNQGEAKATPKKPQGEVQGAPQGFKTPSSFKSPTSSSHITMSHKENNVAPEEGAELVYEDIDENGRKKKDPNLTHPAVKFYRSATHLQVPIIWRKKLVQAVGVDHGEVLRWQTLVVDWIGMGWNKGNIKGMIEAFKNGGIQKKNKTGETFEARRDRRRKMLNGDPD